MLQFAGAAMAAAPGGALANPPPLTVEDFVRGYEALKRVRLVSATGKHFDVAHYRGRALLINLWAYWCPNCVAEFESMRALQQSVGGDSQLAIALISLPENWSQDQVFANQHGLTFPMFEAVYRNQTPEANDVNGMLLTYNDNGVVRNGLPQTYIVTRRGDIVGVLRGGQDWNAPPLGKTMREIVALY